jgi:NAD(P)-dependent dehydrogenase (short-subunit alcohol dehydrogenase family)
MSLVSMIKPKGPTGFGYGSTAEDVTQGLDLSGKTILITGSNSGIGLESLRVLAMRGAHVIAAARTVDKATDAIKNAGATSNATPVACELSDPESVRRCVDTVKATGRPIDVLMLNAGIMALPKLEQAFGYELQFFTNHIGHFLLTQGLLEVLSDTARVVALSSEAHRMAPRAGIAFDNLDGSRGYDPWKSYGQSKLANLLFASELARQFQGTRKSAFAVHPGVIRTNLGRHMNPVLNSMMGMFDALTLKNVAEGAATQCYVAVHPDATQSGAYFADSNVKVPSKPGRDPELARRLWDESERIITSL